MLLTPIKDKKNDNELQIKNIRIFYLLQKLFLKSNTIIIQVFKVPQATIKG